MVVVVVVEGIMVVIVVTEAVVGSGVAVVEAAADEKAIGFALNLGLASIPFIF